MNDFSRRRPPGAPPAASATGAPRLAFDYGGSVGELARIVLVNVLLGVLTLGFYRFWGKTRLRQYLWGHVGFEGEPLEYTGRGMELFVGFLVVIAVLLPVGLALGIIDYALTGQPELRAVSGLLQLVVVLFLVNYAIFRARRYRLTRTQWRGIRGGQTGSAVRYAVMALFWLVATVVSLGLAYPVMQTRLQRYLVENTWFGSQSLEFSGAAKALFPRWLVAWLLFLPTLGLSWLWYRVQAFRYYVGETSFGGLEFASQLSFGRVLWVAARFLLALSAVSALLTAFFMIAVPGFGFGFMAMAPEQVDPTLYRVMLFALVPYVLLLLLAFSVLRIAVFLHLLLAEVCNSLHMRGLEDYDAIRQSAQERPRFGEGLADALDVGSI